MRALTTPEMLSVWERGLTGSPLQRSLMLLAASAEDPVEAVAKLSAGQRDAALLSVREWAFGYQLAAVTSCPGCGERVEMELRTHEVRIMPVSDTVVILPLKLAGYELLCRPPNSLDLIAIDCDHDKAKARRQLLGRCLSEITCDGAKISVEELPGEVISAAVERIAQADPQADVRMALSCPRCAHQWQAGFDIGTFLWAEIDAWAQRILRDVHMLASAYGWREVDILTMSPWRRQFYLNCIGK